MKHEEVPEQSQMGILLFFGADQTVVSMGNRKTWGKRIKEKSTKWRPVILKSFA